MYMSDFDQQLYSLGLRKVMSIYLRRYFDIHGDILPVDGIYSYLIKEIEKSLIEETLRRLKGNQVQVAKLLGINRNTLRRKIQDLNISFKMHTHDISTNL